MKKAYIVYIETIGPAPSVQTVSSALMGGLEDEHYWYPRMLSVLVEPMKMPEKTK